MNNDVDLIAELQRIGAALNDAGVEYALCGGLAVAVHGHARATQDIDLLVRADQIPAAVQVATALGFDLPALPMQMGATPITRRSRIVGTTVLPLDLLHTSPETDDVLSTRIAVPWRGGILWSVSREGLIRMKRLAARPQDLADIAALEAKHT